MMSIRNKLLSYVYLMRLDKPIGILLLLWPTLWALWLAAAGHPDKLVLIIFVAGVILTRSAGCILNDFADREFDGHVTRTRSRPLVNGKVSPEEALILAAFLALIAFLLVLNCNRLTIELSFIGALLAIIYPFLKRITHLPQLGLGAAFAWGIPMAFAAQIGRIPPAAWVLFIATIIWIVVYDTLYAMVDREDDLRIGVKSTAVLFKQQDKRWIGSLQLFFLILLIIIGCLFSLKYIYFFSLSLVALLFIYQQWLIKNRETQKCFQAFLNNNWVGLILFISIAASYL